MLCGPTHDLTLGLILFVLHFKFRITSRVSPPCRWDASQPFPVDTEAAVEEAVAEEEPPEPSWITRRRAFCPLHHRFTIACSLLALLPR